MNKVIMSAMILFASLPAAAQQKSGEAVSASTENDKIEKLEDRIEELNELVEELEKTTGRAIALDISGFFDVSVSNYKNKPNVFKLGKFEIDLEHNYKENFQVAAALVFQKGAELDVGFIDYHLFGSPISLRGRLFQDEGLHLQVGKFDVPFGNDWQHFAAIDSIPVTPPLTTEMVMDGGYNDEGVRILYNSIWLNATLYMLDGIEEKYSYGGNSYGGRVGFTPFNNPYLIKSRSLPIFELGFAYIYDTDNEGRLSERLYACDVESKVSFFFVQAEYYKRDKKAGVVFDGCHVTGGIDLSEISNIPIILFGRYDYFRMKDFIPETYIEVIEQKPGTEDILIRVTGGLNINIYNISFLKIEYQRFIDTYEEYRDQYYSQSLYWAQLVITF